MTRTATRSYDCPGPSRRRAARTPTHVRRPEGTTIASPIIRIEVDDQTFEAPLPAAAVTIGKGDDADLRLGCEGVATSHCEIRPLPDGRHVLKDLGSGYGTSVNGIEAKQVSLRPGDVIEVGEARITYTLEEPEPEPVPVPAGGAGAGDGPSGSSDALPTAATVALQRKQRASGHPLTGPVIALGVAAVVALALAFVLGSGDEDEAAAAERRLEYALDLYRARDYAAAKAALEELSLDPSASSQTRRIDRYLKQTGEAIQSAESELERYWAQRLDFDVSTFATTRRMFEQKHGALLAARFDELMPKIREAQAVWMQETVGTTKVEVGALLDQGEFARAQAAWAALRDKGFAGVNLRQAVDEGLASVGTRAGAAVTVILREAEEAEREQGAKQALFRVKRELRKFEGLPPYARLVEASEAYEAKVRAETRTPPPTVPTPTGPTPATPTPPDDTTRQAVTAALAAADELAQAWKFDQAVKGLAEAIQEHGAVATLGDDLRHRHRDLDLADQGRAALVEIIKAHPERFRRIETGPNFYVDLIGADAETVTAAVRGGRTGYRWASMPTARLATIAARAKPEGEAALGVAALLREVGEPEAAEAHVFAAREGVEPEALFALLARWRGEDVPEGGYVVHADRLVTPKDRERLLLLARIEDAVKRVRRKDPKVWKAAAEELMDLGPSARPSLVEALNARRSDVIDEFAKLKVFTSGRTKQKLFTEMEKRRSHALVLIRNASAWPYPNPSNQNTDEVVARVDAVREVWERPFDVIVTWSKDAKDKLSMVTEVDEYLVRADPTFQPTLDDVRDRVNREVDMPTFTPSAQSKSVREYSLKVLAYNEKLDTTATREEKNCVLAVNEYRMMMGHWAVKINERLTRAARGHSHHMRENEYFAHNVPANKNPTDLNRTPGHRARAQGYGGGVGENIARGTWTGRDAFWAWFKSSGHHRNMINAGWTEMGAGRSGGNWWTQLFGRAGGKKLSLPDKEPDPAPFFAPEPEDASGRPAQPGAPQLPDEPPVVPPDFPDEPAPDEPTDD